MKTGTAGSFDANQTPNGTPAAAKSGNYATRLFMPDNDSQVLATYGSASWPSWLQRFEIGVSGTQNTASPNAACANFAQTGEDTAMACNYQRPVPGAAPSPQPFACGATPPYFRVSEWDCASAVTAKGNGSDTDGIYLRAYFSRAPGDLAPQENVMAVIQYSASAWRPGPTTPVQCFAGGLFSPESCADFTWQAFLRADGGASPVQPFMLVMPPFSGSVNNAAASSGTGVMTKQIVLPLSSNPALNVFQLSRTGSTIPAATDPGFATFSLNCGTNSPDCAGVVFYAITFYRI